MCLVCKTKTQLIGHHCRSHFTSVGYNSTVIYSESKKCEVVDPKTGQKRNQIVGRKNQCIHFLFSLQLAEGMKMSLETMFVPNTG